MTDEPIDVPITALLREARGAYGAAVSHALHEAGFDDIPRNGPFVLAGMTNFGGSAEDVIRWLGATKQAASQLIDTLVLRGYLERSVNPEDRRRITIVATERGRAAAAAVRTGVETIDAELEEMVTPAELAGLRAGLIALAELKERHHEH